MRRRLPAPALVVLLAAVLLPAPAAAQLPTASSDIAVIDPGDEPRRELRYAWTADHHERLESAVTIDIDATEAGTPVMDMRLPVSLTVDAIVTRVEDNASAWVAMTYEDLVFGPLTTSGGGVDDPDALAATFDETMAEVAPLLADARVWQQISDRGRVIRTNAQFPAGFPPEASQQITQTSGSVALLPREPVGVGARWEATGTTVTQGLAISVTTTMELLAIDRRMSL